MANNADIKCAHDEEEPSNIGLISSFLCLCTATILVVWLYPRGPNLTIISNPFTNAQQAMTIIDASESQFVNQGRVGWITNIYAPESDALARLFSSGALLVIRNFAPSTCLQEVQS